MEYDDLPLADFDYKTKVKSVVDVHRNYDPVAEEGNPWDLAQITDMLKQERFEDLPRALHPAVIPANCPPMKMQINIRPVPREGQEDPQRYDILKVFMAEGKHDVELFRGFCKGTPKKVTYLCPRAQEAKKAFQYLFEMLGGVSCLWNIIEDPQHQEDDDAVWLLLRSPRPVGPRSFAELSPRHGANMHG